MNLIGTVPTLSSRTLALCLRRELSVIRFVFIFDATLHEAEPFVYILSGPLTDEIFLAKGWITFYSIYPFPTSNIDNLFLFVRCSSAHSCCVLLLARSLKILLYIGSWEVLMAHSLMILHHIKKMRVNLTHWTKRPSFPRNLI